MGVRLGPLLLGLFFALSCKSSGGAMSGPAGPGQQNSNSLISGSGSIGAPTVQSNAPAQVAKSQYSAQSVDVLEQVCALSPTEAQSFSASPASQGKNRIETLVNANSELDSLRDLSKQPLGERVGRLALSVTAAGLYECALLKGWLEQSYADGLRTLCTAPITAKGQVPKPYSDQHIYNRASQKVLRQFNKADPEKKRTIMREAMARGEKTTTFECAFLAKH